MLEYQEGEICYEKVDRKYLGIIWYNNIKGSKNIDTKYKALYHCLSIKKDNEYGV